MRFAYADPPYLGNAKKLYGDATYDDPEEHRRLILELEPYDAWALSFSTPSLKVILPMCPEDARIGAWVKPFASFKPGVDPAYTWEPVIYRSARKWSRDQPTCRDYISCNITLKKGLTGAKPEDFCYWLFRLLGARPGDQFDDLFPGTGGVIRAWEEWRDVQEQSP